MKKLVLLAILLAAPLGAEDRPVIVSVQGGALALLSPAGHSARPVAYIEIDGPLALGSKARGRVFGELAFAALPGETLELSDVETFRSAEAGFGLGFHLGGMSVGDQRIETLAVGEWGFASMLPNEAEARDRLVRHYGIGLRFTELSSRSYFQVIYGRAEAAGPRGWGQWQVRGRVAIPFTSGVGVLGGDAVASAGPERPLCSEVPTGESCVEGAQQDFLRVWVALDLGQLAKAVDR